jgi:autotransporter-associated beta strand protein
MNLAGPDAPVAPSFYPVLPTATPVTLAANGTLDLNGVSQQIASLNDATPGSGGTVINSNTSTTTVLTLSPTGSATFSGSIVGGTLGTISLVMNGPGTQVLSGTNTYLGGTTVENGTLVVANNEAIEDGTNLTVGDPSAFMAPVVPSPAAAAAVSPVPEPGTLGLLAALAAAAAVGLRRRIGLGQPARLRRARDAGLPRMDA